MLGKRGYRSPERPSLILETKLGGTLWLEAGEPTNEAEEKYLMRLSGG